MSATDAARALEHAITVGSLGGELQRAHIYFEFVNEGDFDTAYEALEEVGFDALRRPMRRYDYKIPGWVIETELVREGVGVYLRRPAE